MPYQDTALPLSYGGENLAGDIGFEPMHVGIKIRCLNQLGESPTKTYYNTLEHCCQECVLKSTDAYAL